METKCFMCERTGVVLDYHDTDDNPICERCFEYNFFYCGDCDQLYNLEDSRDVYIQGMLNGRCIDCVENNYSECYNCHHLVRNNEGVNDALGYLCFLCGVSINLIPRIGRDLNEGMNVSRPHLDTSVKTFQDTKKGKIITDKRMFSTEIECYYPDTNSYSKVLKDVTNNFRGTGQVGDGSLDSQGIEFQTPILRGAKGEKYIRDFSKLLLDNKFYVNTKAGTHIHLDGEGFTVKSLFSDEEINNIRTNYLFNVKTISSDFQYLINQLRHWTRYGDNSNTTRYPNGVLESVSDIMQAVYKGSTDHQTLSKEADKAYLHNIKNKELCNKNISQLTRSLIQRLDGDSYIKYQSYNSNKMSERLLPAMKRLFTVYYFADDFIMQILPHSRRNNKYCLPLWKEFNITNIDRLGSIEEFEKMWYQLDDLHHIIEKRQDPKDITRRHGANFHILMCQGHFELRYHSGTINADKILYWVALNQALMNLATVGGNKFQEIRQELENIRFIQNLKLRRHRMYYLLELPNDAIAYWESRAEKFTDENELAPVVARVGNSQDL